MDKLINFVKSRYNEIIGVPAISVIPVGDDKLVYKVIEKGSTEENLFRFDIDKEFPMLGHSSIVIGRKKIMHIAKSINSLNEYGVFKLLKVSTQEKTEFDEEKGYKTFRVDIYQLHFDVAFLIYVDKIFSSIANILKITGGKSHPQLGSFLNSLTEEESMELFAFIELSKRISNQIETPQFYEQKIHPVLRLKQKGLRVKIQLLSKFKEHFIDVKKLNGSLEPQEEYFSSSIGNLSELKI